MESTAQRMADLVQALRGAERERLIVAVEEGGGVGGLSVKIFQKTVRVHICGCGCVSDMYDTPGLG